MSDTTVHTPADTPCLILESVSRNFGGLQALNNLSLQAPPGQVTGLIGPNGAGKSTVVNLISGLAALSKGSIRYGRDIGSLPPHHMAALRIARTFQNIRLLKEETVLDNVIAGGHMHDRSGALDCFLGLPKVGRERRALATRAEALIEKYGLSTMKNELCGNLPYGYQRIVEIVRALMLGPTLLLLDEPVAGMNDVEADNLTVHIRNLADEGMAVLLIEHNMRFVMGICNHIYVISSGKLITSGSPQEVRTHPEVIQAYLGA